MLVKQDPKHKNLLQGPCSKPAEKQRTLSTWQLLKQGMTRIVTYYISYELFLAAFSR